MTKARIAAALFLLALLAVFVVAARTVTMAPPAQGPSNEMEEYVERVYGTP